VQDKRGNPTLDKPLSGCGAFAVRYDIAVAAAGNHQDSGVRWIRGGQIDIDRRAIRVGVTERSRNGAWIDVERLAGRCLRAQQARNRSKQDQESVAAHGGKCNRVLLSTAVIG
jgi:hypothetical protein